MSAAPAFLTTDPMLLPEHALLIALFGGDDTDLVPVTCWCERATVKVPLADVRDGIGAVCDHCA